MDPAACTHPQAAHHYDRPRGIITCSQCGEVVNEEAFELDPAFARGEVRGAAPMRTAGFARPGRGAAPTSMATQRPSVQAARAALSAIARQLDIPGDHVEIALGVYKSAVNTNCVVGARNSVLCACLYIVCRRKGTPHMILDFSDVTGESPYHILKHLKTISVATSTALPTVDASYYLTRLAAHLNLGDSTDEVTLFALKILRAMKSDWIHTGRRPLGPCAAALIVACRAAGIDRTITDINELVRLSSATITLRLSEFLGTDAATLADIDNYAPSSRSNPMAFLRGREKDNDYSFMNAAMELSASYWELVEGAKEGREATEERCVKWRDFWKSRQEMQRKPALVGGAPVEPQIAELDTLDHKEQLALLGLPQERVVTPKTADEYKEELTQMMETQEKLDSQKEQETAETAGGNEFSLAAGGGARDEEEERRLELAREAQKQLLENLAIQFPTSQRDKLEIIVLPEEDDDEADPILDQYILFDNEARIQREEVAIKTYGDLWARGAPSENLVLEPEDPRYLTHLAASLADGKKGMLRGKRRRSEVQESATAAASIAAGLKHRGAGQIDLEGLANLLPDAGKVGPTGAGASSLGDELDSLDDEWPID